ncbi:hypothetical protein L9F63_006797, partial [Diploptera punctata]
LIQGALRPSKANIILTHFKLSNIAQYNPVKYTFQFIKIRIELKNELLEPGYRPQDSQGTHMVSESVSQLRSRLLSKPNLLRIFRMFIDLVYKLLFWTPQYRKMFRYVIRTSPSYFQDLFIKSK